MIVACQAALSKGPSSTSSILRLTAQEHANLGAAVSDEIAERSAQKEAGGCPPPASPFLSGVAYSDRSF
jgi:hypothetical protein